MMKRKSAGCAGNSRGSKHVNNPPRFTHGGYFGPLSKTSTAKMRGKYAIEEKNSFRAAAAERNRAARTAVPKNHKLNNSAA